MASFSEMSPRSQLLLLAFMAAALVFAGEYALLSPQVAANDAARQQVQTLETANLRLRPLVGQLARLEAENRRLEAQWKQAQAMLPEQRATDDFLRELQQVAVQRNLHLRRVQAQTLMRRQYYLEEPYKVLLDGSYSSVLQFYQELDRLPRIVSVSHLALNGMATGGGGAYAYMPGETLKAECVITTYFSPAGQPAEANPKGSPKGSQR